MKKLIARLFPKSEQKLKRFIVIQDYTVLSIWDELILGTMLTLPSKPQGWTRAENKNPEGAWTLACGHHQIATPGAYAEAGISEPSLEQIPAIYCIDGDVVNQQFNVTAETAAAFIKEHLAA